jgi:PAS domain S-box-containing protein
MKRYGNIIQTNQLTGKQFKALIENAHEGIVLYDEEGCIRYATPAVRNITGFKSSEVLGRSGTEFVHPDDRDAAKEGFYDVMRQRGKSVTLFQRIRHRKGHYIWCESRLTNFLNVPEINGVVSNFRDITEHKLAEEQARNTRDLVETVNRNLSEGIFMGVLNREFIYVNEAFLTLLGYKTFNQLRKGKPEIIFASLKERNRILRALKEKLALKNTETKFRRQDGSAFDGVLNVRLLKHEGKGDYFVGTIRDISKEKKAERDLLESRNFLDNLINTVAAPIFVKDEKGKLVTFNDQFCDLVGQNRKTLTANIGRKVNLAGDLEKLWRDDAEIFRSGKTMTKQERLKVKGVSRDILLIKARYVNERGEKFVIASMTDVTHLKRAEEEIKSLHENLEGVLESTEESIFSVDHRLKYMSFNNRHKQIMKILYDADVAIGEDKMQYIKNTVDESWIRSELRRALKGEHFVTEHYQNFPKYRGYIQTTYNPIYDEHEKIKGVAVFVQDVTHRKRYEQIINAINANLRAVMESTSDGIVAIDKNFKVIIFNNSYAQGIKDVYGIDMAVGVDFLKVLPKAVSSRVRANAAEVFLGKQFTIETEHPGQMILETSFNPIYDDQGGVTGAALFIRNVTERKRMEERLKQLNQELTEQNIQLATQEGELKAALRALSERNFELDQLMYKTSHDLRSPLSSIIGLINVANIDPDPTSFKEYLAKIEGRAKKLDEFIRSMLDYARVNRLDVEPEEIDIQQFVKNCIAELEYMENFKRVRTTVRLKPRDLKIQSDRLRLKVIFSNIISNAYKYANTQAESFLDISVRQDKNGLGVEFKDNGIGIKNEYLPKIFDMFYRATERSQGSGLGMYIVKQAVEKLGGKITIESTYGLGTTIQITLPRL